MEESIDHRSILIEVSRIIDKAKHLPAPVADREAVEQEIDAIIAELKLSNARIDRNQTEIDNLKAETRKLIANLTESIE